MPAARAMTFLSAPASSTPSTSVAEYTRKNPVEKTCCTCWATACSRAAATTAVGWRAYTSWAKDGPDSTAISRPAGNSSRRSEEHTSELQSQSNLVCRLLLEKKTRNEGERHTPLTKRPLPAI